MKGDGKKQKQKKQTTPTNWIMGLTVGVSSLNPPHSLQTSHKILEGERELSLSNEQNAFCIQSQALNREWKTSLLLLKVPIFNASPDNSTSENVRWLL